jgi:hypothetical protein
MKALAFAIALGLAPAVSAGEPAHGGNKNGADAFRDVVVACLVAGMEAGHDDPVALADECIAATQRIWAVAYGPPYLPHPLQ